MLDLMLLDALCGVVFLHKQDKDMPYFLLENQHHNENTSYCIRYYMNTFYNNTAQDHGALQLKQENTTSLPHICGNRETSPCCECARVLDAKQFPDYQDGYSL
jgi:hypothetical protein